MVDIAVPRDIEVEVGELDDIYLYTVDDLQEVIQENMRSRQEAADQAQEIVDFHSEEFMGWFRSLDAVGLVQDYRQQAEIIRDEVLSRAQRQLRNGKDPQQVLEYLANTLTNKILHTPSTQIREAGQHGQTELLEAANALLKIKQDGGTSS
jgi:glutamyl-tRNA reductase